MPRCSTAGGPSGTQPLADRLTTREDNDPAIALFDAAAEGGLGVIVTLTHPLDYLRYLLGEVERLWSLNGHISPLELEGVEDTAEMGLKFTSGAIAGVHVNYFQRPPVHRLEIVGTSGTLDWDNSDGLLTHYRMPDEFGLISAQPNPAQVKRYTLPDGFERNHLFIAQTRHFLQVARGEAEPACSLEDGIRALEMALAAIESQKTGHLIDLR